MKIKLWCNTHDSRSDQEEDFDPEDLGFTIDEIRSMSDDTKALLEDCAKEFFWNNKEPAWGFEIVED